MRKTWAVVRKELRQIRRDPLSLLVLAGLPAFLLVVYGFALNFDVRHVALAVQDRDRSAASRDLVAAFVNSTYFDLVASPEAGDDLESLTQDRLVRAVLVVPEGFGRTLAEGRTAPVQLLLDGSDASTATTVLGYAGTLVAERDLELLTGALAQAGLERPPGIRYEPRVWYNPELQSARFLVPGLVGVLLMLTAVLSTALSVVREKERGTMEQIRVSPLATVQLILGKTIPYLGISLLATTTILVAARLLFGVVVRGSYLDLLLATLLYLVGALGFGLLISTVADSQTLAFQVGLLASLLPAVLLSGFVFQIRVMPAWLQAITLLVPARYYLVILRGVILKGASLSPYWEQMAALGAYALLTLGLAVARLARREA